MKRFLKLTAVFLVTVVFAAAVVVGYFWYVWSSNLPVLDALKEYRPPIITEIYSSDGEVIGRFWKEKRIVVPLSEISEQTIHAFVAAEDARFFKHEGVDFVSIIRAFLKNLSAGKIEQGGSTITQQVTKSLLLKNTRRTYRRKAREAILSMQLEKNFSKQRILFLYLNQIYLGQGAYGVEAAARTYFGKPASELTLAESALLAGLPQAPARYSPVAHFKRARARQRYVLERMVKAGYISAEEMTRALQAPLCIRKTTEDVFRKCPYFTEYVRRYLLKTFGAGRLYRGGLEVYTTVDLKMQRAADNAVLKGLSDLDKREGFRGPLRHLEPEEIPPYLEAEEKKHALKKLETGEIVEAVVDDVNDPEKTVSLRIGSAKARLPLKKMKWARKPDPDVPYYAARLDRPSRALRKGDVILVRLSGRDAATGVWEVSLEQRPLVQGALLCMDPQTGEVKAMVGGRDFFESQFNRAIQARRQPGSAFKPFIYAAALDRGMSPADVIIDAPYVSERMPDSELWKPKNYKGTFFGPTLFRTALAKSRNVITVKILRKIGVNHVVEYARKMGIESHLNPDLSLALGSSGVSLMELTRAYCVFANGGMLVTPIFIRKVLDRSGRVLEEKQPESRPAISPQTAYVMTDLLKAVIREGTGWRIRALRRPAAGKTGTTNNLWDAWFMGYTPELVTGVWVGYDDRKAMGRGETGSRAASPIWLMFMSEVLKDRPVADFPVPKGVVFAKIDAKTGLLAGPYSGKTVFQAFRKGTEPKTYSPRADAPKAGQFLQLDLGGETGNR